MKQVELPLPEEIDEILDSDVSNKIKIDYLKKNVLTPAGELTKTYSNRKGGLTKRLKSGKISLEEKNIQYKIIEERQNVIKQYIAKYGQHLKNLKGTKTKKGSGLGSFFTDPNELLQKLEVIASEIQAGNNNKEIRNAGVAILDFPLEKKRVE